MNRAGAFTEGYVCSAGRCRTMPGSWPAFFVFTVLAILSVLVQAGLRLWLHRVGLHIPGISALVWMPLMVAGKLGRPRGLSASSMALVLSAADMLAMPLSGPSAATWGVFTAALLKYGISGLILDALWPFVSMIRPGSPAYLFAVAGATALALAGKALFVLASCALPGIPLPDSKLHIVVLHAAFGACAGLVAVFVSSGDAQANRKTSLTRIMPG